MSFRPFFFLLLVGACTGPSRDGVDVSNLSPEQKIIVEKGISKGYCYTQTDEQKRYQSAETTYDDHGNVSQMVFLLPAGDTLSIECHRYDAQNRLIETLEGNSLRSLETTLKVEFDDAKHLETETSYKVRKGKVARSIYQNDSSGRNLNKVYFVDDSLIATYKYIWDANGNMVRTEGYASTGELQVRLENRYLDQNCTHTLVFKDEELIKADSNAYDDQGLVIFTQTTVPGKYSDQIELEYEEGLLVRSTSQFENLQSTPVVTSKKRDEWEYR
ncbi:MAG: hypothetical protein ACFB10_09955 [Salibacteraceae bacterium]